MSENPMRISDVSESADRTERAGITRVSVRGSAKATCFTIGVAAIGTGVARATEENTVCVRERQAST